MTGFQLQRLGMVMEPEPGNPLEAEGVLNPAAVRGPDGQLYLFPRLVARGNYSRIGIARVRFNEAGDPAGVERLGIALEPEEDYELRPDGGGCEDPRITFVEPLQHYVMTYTAFSPQGPRIALALSKDLFHWQRLGLATFGPYDGVEFDGVDNKDASVFPVAIPDPAGQPALAMLHRPLFPGTRPEETARHPASRTAGSPSRKHLDFLLPHGHGGPMSHITSATLPRITGWRAPVSSWERLKIGGGTPPILTRHGWLVIYHGVSEAAESSSERTPSVLLGRGDGALEDASALYPLSFPEPVLTPSLPQERQGTVANVVFPTGIDRRVDLGSPTASTSITGWPTTGSAWRAWTCRTPCRQGRSPTIRPQSLNSTGGESESV